MRSYKVIIEPDYKKKVLNIKILQFLGSSRYFMIKKYKNSWKKYIFKIIITRLNEAFKSRCNKNIKKKLCENFT